MNNNKGVPTLLNDKNEPVLLIQANLQYPIRNLFESMLKMRNQGLISKEYYYKWLDSVLKLLDEYYNK
jgi:hypothetical protein